MAPRRCCIENRECCGFSRTRRRVAIFFEDFTDGGIFGTNHGIIAGIPVDNSDASESDRVMVPTGNQRGACRRAKSCRMKLRVTQTCIRNPVERRRRNNATKCTRHAVALIIRHDQQNVRCAFGRHDSWWPPRCGILGAFLDDSTKLLGRRGVVSIDRCCCARRAWCASHLLSVTCCGHDDKNRRDQYGLFKNAFYIRLHEHAPNTISQLSRPGDIAQDSMDM